MKGVGEILVKIYRASAGVATPARFTKKSPSNKAYNVHEKALKGQAKSHNTS